MKIYDLLTKSGRRLNLARRRSTWLRHNTPFYFIYLYNNLSSRLTEYRSWHTAVKHRTTSINIYHCCVVKTGSQWIRSLLSDLAVFRFSGLSYYHYQSRRFKGRDPRERMTERHFPDPFPANSVVSPLYIGYKNFEEMPKPAAYKAFFVMRDPRDIVVSWYFSTRYTHIMMSEEFGGMRRQLHNLPIGEGMIYSIHQLAREGLFETLESWRIAGEDNPNIMLVKYEDLAAENNLDQFSALFDFLDIGVADTDLAELLDAYSFRRVSGGRKQGDENLRSHLRKGVAGDWENYFDSEVQREFDEQVGDLPSRLGYR